MKLSLKDLLTEDLGSDALASLEYEEQERGFNTTPEDGSEQMDAAFAALRGAARALKGGNVQEVLRSLDRVIVAAKGARAVVQQHPEVLDHY